MRQLTANEEGYVDVKARRRMGHRGLIVLIGVLALAGCKDNGLPGKNLPLAEARHRETSYPLYERTPDAQPVAAAGLNWMPSQTVEQIPDAMLEPVGNAGDTPLFAVRSDEPPYDRLYAPVASGEWRPFLSLH